jgi:hypothetical protein
VAADSTAIAADDVGRRTGWGQRQQFHCGCKTHLGFLVCELRHREIVVVTSRAPTNEIVACDDKIFVV